MAYFLVHAAGLIIGSVVVTIFWRLRTGSGILKIDTNNPEKDIYRLEISDLDKLAKKKRIMLKVDTNADFSQE